MKILLVEDDRFFAQRISEYLQDNGLEVTIVQTATQALETDIAQYSVAILDLMLPNDPEVTGISMGEARGGFLTGIAVLRKLRRMNATFPAILFSSDMADGEGRRWASENGTPFLLKVDPPRRLLSALHDLGIKTDPARPQSFIVHGHDDKAVLELKDYLQNTLKWPEPIVLRDQASCGKTIIEKFEEHAGKVDWVFVLLTPDDAAAKDDTDDERRRARQNVIFELGFFYGLLGRHDGRVIALKKGAIELPSDIQGIIWINIDKGIQASGEEIRREVEPK